MNNYINDYDSNSAEKTVSNIPTVQEPFKETIVHLPFIFPTALFTGYKLGGIHVDGEFFEKRYEILTTKTSAYKNVIADLEEIKPDFIINLHQRAPITTPVIMAAKVLGIKNSTVIFSWDNVPKARLISRPQNYFVWSALMKKQLCLLYREINPKNVFVVGSPQFEFHKREEFRLTKETFFTLSS